jgi:hypothetical protein
LLCSSPTLSPATTTALVGLRTCSASLLNNRSSSNYEATCPLSPIARLRERCSGTSLPASAAVTFVSHQTFSHHHVQTILPLRLTTTWRIISEPNQRGTSVVPTTAWIGWVLSFDVRSSANVLAALLVQAPNFVSLLKVFHFAIIQC